MTRTLSITDTSCSICKQWYETVEEAIDCEAQCEREEEATREDEEFWSEYYATQEQEHWEASDEYLTSLHGVNFNRP